MDVYLWIIIWFGTCFYIERSFPKWGNGENICEGQEGKWGKTHYMKVSICIFVYDIFRSAQPFGYEEL